MQVVRLLERCLRLVVSEVHPRGYLELMRTIFKLVIQVGRMWFFARHVRAGCAVKDGSVYGCCMGSSSVPA